MNDETPDDSCTWRVAPCSSEGVMRKRLASIAFGAVLLAGCGGGSASGVLGVSGAHQRGIPPAYSKTSCADTFKEGAKANVDGQGRWDPTCTENGHVVINFTITQDCPDGSVAAYTDQGWEARGVVHAGAFNKATACG